MLKLLIGAVTGFFSSLWQKWLLFRAGRRVGKAETEVKQATEKLDAVAAAVEIENEVESLDRVRLRDRAGRWVRNPTPDRTKD